MNSDITATKIARRLNEAATILHLTGLVAILIAGILLIGLHDNHRTREHLSAKLKSLEAVTLSADNTIRELRRYFIARKHAMHADRQNAVAALRASNRATRCVKLFTDELYNKSVQTALLNELVDAMRTLHPPNQYGVRPEALSLEARFDQFTLHDLAIFTLFVRHDPIGFHTAITELTSCETVKTGAAHTPPQLKELRDHLHSLATRPRHSPLSRFFAIRLLVVSMRTRKPLWTICKWRSQIYTRGREARTANHRETDVDT